MNLRWRINRLRMMSFEEVIFRCIRELKTAFQFLKLKSGCLPICPQNFGNSTGIIDRNCLLESTHCTEDITASLLLSGKLDLLQYSELEVGWPINWHRDPTTGIESPRNYFGKKIDYRDDSLVGNIKVLWELGRQQFLVPIALSYFRNPTFEKFTALKGTLESWLTQNRYGAGIHWCSSLEVALRGISWSLCHQILLSAGLKSGIFELVDHPKNLQNQIYQHALFIRGHLSRYSSANNHLIGELTGLHTICSSFEMGEKGESLRNFAWHEIENEAEKQVHEDGVNKEQAIYYHLWVLEYLLLNLTIRSHRKSPVSSEYLERLSVMAQFANDLRPPGGELPMIGDADDGCAIKVNRGDIANYHQDLISIVTLLAGHRPAKISCKANLYRAMAAKDFRGILRAPSETFYPSSFDSGGYAVLGDPNLHAVFKCSDLGYPVIAAHGHADIGNLCLAIDGRWWLIDPGTYAYHSDAAWRNYFRSSSAHNVLVINEADQSEIGGPFMWLRRADVNFHGAGLIADIVCSAGSHNGYKSAGVRSIHREIRVSTKRQEICLIDTVISTKTADARLHLHFHPEISCIDIGENAFLLNRSTENSELKLEFDNAFSVAIYKGDEKSKLGWYSPALGKKVPSLTFCARTALRAETTTFTTRLSVNRKVIEDKM